VIRPHLLVIPIIAALALFAGALPGRADDEFNNVYTVHPPSSLAGFNSFDIMWTDAATHTLVATDRNNKSIDIYDSQDVRFLRRSNASIDFAGLNASSNPCNEGGPNGVLTIARGDEDRGHRHDRHGDENQVAAANFDTARDVALADDHDDGDRGNAWVAGAGPGASSLVVVDVNSGNQVGADIPTGGKCRADELGFGPGEDEVMLGNPSDTTVFETFISTTGTPGPNSVLAQLFFDGTGGATGTCAKTPAPGLAAFPITGLTHDIQVCHTPTGDVATGGIEQPIFADGAFWVNVPATTANPDGIVAKIDPDGYQWIGGIAMPVGSACGGTGLAVVDNTHAAAECGGGVQFLNLSGAGSLNGSGATSNNGSGGADEIWYADGNVYGVNTVNLVTNAGCALKEDFLGPTAPTTKPATPAFPTLTGVTDACLFVVPNGASAPIDEVQLPSGSRNVTADSGNGKVFVPVKDFDCSTTSDCSKAPSEGSCTAVVPEDPAGGCAHGGGIQVIVSN